MCAIHLLHKLSRAELGLKCLAQEELNPFKCYLNINNNKLLAAGCWCTPAAALHAGQCCPLGSWRLLPEVPAWSRHSRAPSSWSGCIAQPWNWHAEAGKWWAQLCYQNAEGRCDGCEGSVATNILQRDFGVGSGQSPLEGGWVPAAWPLLCPSHGAGGVISTGKLAL